MSSSAQARALVSPGGSGAQARERAEPAGMNTSLEQTDFEKQTSSDSGASEAGACEPAAMTPQRAVRLWLNASLALTRAQQELHDAIFALDGSEESLDRYAAARSELDSAEAWALRIAKTVPRQRY